MSNLVNYFNNVKKADVCYKSILGNGKNDILACGFLRKSNGKADKNLQLNYYGGLILLCGGGYYFDGKTRIELTSGSFVQRLPGVKHTTVVTSEEDWLEFFLCINSSSYDNLCGLGLMRPQPVLNGSFSNELQDKLLTFFIKLKKATDSELTALFFEAQSLLCEITAQCTYDKTDKSLYAECVSIINNFRGRISGREIAKRLNVSYESLRKSFKRSAGQPIEKFVISTRINLIKKELLETDASPTSVYDKYGYADYATFSKQFKKHEGVPPKEFINRNKLI